jgi:hypothetical protein
MDDEVQKRLVESADHIIKWAEQTGGKVEQFALEQAPLVCQEIVGWKMWSSLFLACVWVLIFIAAALFAAWLRRIAVKDEALPEDSQKMTWDNRCALHVISFLLVVLGTAGLIGGGSACCYDAVKAKVAPRLVILETLHGFTK